MKRITKIDGVEFVPYKDYKKIKASLENIAEIAKEQAGLLNLIRLLIYDTNLSDEEKLETIGKAVDKLFDEYERNNR